MADTARSLLGNEAVAWMEDTAYGIQDWLFRKTRSNAEPEAYWEVPASATADAVEPPPAADAGADAAPAGPKPFRLAAVGPVHDAYEAPGDGVWIELADTRHPDEPARLLKTQLHPDKNRSWTIVAVVAVDLRQVDIHSVAGRYEPESRTPEAKKYERRATIDPAHHDQLIAAFNGGYKATHGYYGMMIDGVTLIPPRPKSCTVAKYDDGRLAVRSWEALADDEQKLVWWRQAPFCMYEEGKPNPVLSMSKLGWGASSVSGTTVIRRSAIGLDEAGEVLYVGIGDHTTAQSIAHAMHHAGAAHVAQLDVNFSYPKFVTYEVSKSDPQKLIAVPLTEHFEYTEDEYIRARSHRDFFYLVRREPAESES
ncbi:MAG: hypothetical protein JRI23_02620 [Deltaproteobacteria bacterium]|nr:hypothetical protein [Deltaproteobacteria bacterium]MBW2530393.1 hypothetical protein [Deltaproteobacteria bacterium]